MTVHAAIVGYVILVRLVELAFDRRNTRRLRARGAVEAGAGHYPLLVAIHVGWIAALALLVPTETPANPLPLAAFIGIQGLRLWVIVSLGEHWTTRILVLPGAPLVRRGPYRWLRHPNYLVVVVEIALLPLVFGAWMIAAVFSLLNALALWHRIRIEEAALAGATGIAAAGRP